MRVLAWPGLVNRQQPYITQLYRHLEALGVEVSEFSPFSTFRESYNVWHMHWPEYRLSPSNPLRAGVQASKLLAEMYAAKLRGTKIVWTAHNLKQHEARHPRLESRFRHHHSDAWRARRLDRAEPGRSAYPKPCV